MVKIEKAGPAGTTGTTVTSPQPRSWHSRLLHKLTLTGSLVGALLGSGCGLQEWVHNGFKVGPNYSRPPAPVAEEWIDYRNPEIKSEPADLSHWWDSFGDKQLSSLIDTAYQQNLSLRVAGSRILEAQAVRGIAVGNLFPQTQQAGADWARIKLSQKRANPPLEAWFQDWSTGVGASWELDFWGRFRRGVEAADAELDASIENYDDVLVILLSDVATNYVQLRTFQERLRIAWYNVVSQYNSYHVAANKYILGGATERDAQQARQVLEQTRALIPQLKTGIRLANNQICILLGFPPRELTELDVGTYERDLDFLEQMTADRIKTLNRLVKEYVPGQRPAEPMPGLLNEKDPKIKDLIGEERGKKRPIPGARDINPDPNKPKPPPIIVGIPADLLRRRPDIRRAERQVAAQSARIGIAESDFYPHLSLLGELGVAAKQFWDLSDTPKSMFGSIGPSVRWDILNYGRILNGVRVQDARFQQLAYTYQNTVLSAGREAEDAIVAFLQAQDQRDRLKESVDAAQRTMTITNEQYKQGAVDYTAVFLFEGTLADQQDQLAVARSNIALNLIRLYRALGGGWEMRLSQDGQGDLQHHGHGHHAEAVQLEGPRVADNPQPARGTAKTVSIRMVPVLAVEGGQVSGDVPAEVLPPPQQRRENTREAP